MDKQEINQLCRLKIQELLDKNFGIIAQDETIEQLDEKYPIDLPETLITEFKAFLQTIIDKLIPNKKGLDTYLNTHSFSLLSGEKYKVEYETYYKKAHEITIYEKVTNSNSNDIAKYKYALYKYVETVLFSIKEDFVYDLENYSYDML